MKARVPGQQEVLKKHNNAPLFVSPTNSFDLMPAKINTDSLAPYQPNDGSVTIFIERGDVEWKSNGKPTEDPTSGHFAKEDTFRPSGQTYIFEFWPRTEKSILQHMKRRAQSIFDQAQMSKNPASTLADSGRSWTPNLRLRKGDLKRGASDCGNSGRRFRRNWRGIGGLDS